MSEYSRDIVGHTAGFALKKLYEKMFCELRCIAERANFISRLSEIKNHEN
jgi:hypothetical protein